VKHSGIAIILPHRERYQQAGGGAVAFCVRDIATYSRYLPQLHVFGDPVETPFDLPPFEGVPLAPPSFRRRTLRYLLAIRKRMKTFRPSLVEVHNRPLIALDQLRHSTGYPVLLYLHNDPLNMRGFVDVRARKELLDRGGYVVGVSDYICRRMLEGLEDHPNRNRVVVVLNGVDTEQPVFNEPMKKRKEILYVGRLIPEKGSLIYAQAMKHVLEAAPDWRAVMIGALKFDEPGRMKPYDSEVLSTMKALGERGEITGYMTREQVLERMKAAELVVIPSLWEDPCPLVAIEAMAAGCAVVTTRRGGLPALVQDAGVLIDDVTPEALTREILGLISDDARRNELQAMASDRAHKDLDVRITSGRLDDLRMSMLSWPIDHGYAVFGDSASLLP